MLKAFKLRFTTPLHFGRGREELDKSELIYHSDSLRSALFSIGLQLFEEWEQKEIFFDGFRISSCFPYAKDELFLPKPVMKKELNIVNVDNDKVSKVIKRIDFLERSIFENYLTKEEDITDIDFENITPDGIFICRDKETYIFSENGVKIKKPFFKTEIQQRVQIPLPGTNDQNSRPFNIDRIFFEKDCGLYFIAEFKDEMIEQQVSTALKILGANGIGTDRTVGNGLFEFDEEKDVISDFKINTSFNNSAYISLGLFLPSQEDHKEIDFTRSSWNLIKRGGYMGGSSFEKFARLRKRSVYMFAEGSILKSNIELKGKVEDLKPNWNDNEMHSVWRDGQCIMLKI